MVHREALLWRQLHHPYILAFLGVDTETFPSRMCLVSPWMQQGTLEQYIMSPSYVVSSDRSRLVRLLLLSTLCTYTNEISFTRQHKAFSICTIRA
jgi:serine/threonine protein kinase